MRWLRQCVVGDVIRLPVITCLDLHADDVLRANIGQYETVVIMGYDADGVERFVSSTGDGKAVNWLLDRMKLKLLAVPESEHFG